MKEATLTLIDRFLQEATPPKFLAGCSCDLNPVSSTPKSDTLSQQLTVFSARTLCNSRMGNKRSHADSEPSGQHHENPDRKRLRTGSNRPHRPKPAVVDLDSLNAIKKRARAIERLLARDNVKLPSHKQRDLERELAAHKQRIEDARAKKDRSKMIQKYHMVRFFGMPTPLDPTTHEPQLIRP